MRHISLTLFLLLQATPTSGQEGFISVCGASYGDASYNCTLNPTCETGDGCPPGKDTCFAVSDTDCKIPPTQAPIVTPLRVCGTDYEDATTRCGDECEVGCGSMEACFSVNPSECVNVTAANITVDVISNGVDLVVEETDVTVCALSFTDALSSCLTGTRCNATDALECATGEACFVVPLMNCTSAETETNATSPITETETNATSPITGETPAPAPTEPPVQPDTIFVCGADYPDALQNCFDNTACPSGDGCAGNYTCFAIPFESCAPETTVAATEAAGSSTTAASATNGTEAAGGSTTAASATNGTEAAGATATVSSDTNATEPASENTTVTVGTTAATSEPNLFFCGESYELAQENCFTNTPCPAGGGCPDGQACFGIPSECLSPEPTGSPSAVVTTLVSTEGTTTDDSTPALRTAVPTASPGAGVATEAPIINTHFCGANYTDAEASCDFDRACPGGFECPSEQTCFTGITCAATAPAEAAPTASPGEEGASTSPTLRGTSSSSTNATSGGAENATIDLSDYLVFRYCGSSPEDARDNCATNTPCLDGTDDDCPLDQVCFELDSACSAVVGDGDGEGDDIPAPAPTTLAPSTPTDHVFDPNITSYCGVDFDDAQANCYYATPCPTNSNAECDDGETCFPGITGCEIPQENATTMAPSAPAGNETNGTTTPMEPSTLPTKKPSYDLSGFGDSSSGRNGSVARGYNVGLLVFSGLAGVIATLIL